MKIFSIRPVAPAQVCSLCLPHRSTAIGALNEFLCIGHSWRLGDCCRFTAPPNGVDSRDFTDTDLTTRRCGHRTASGVERAGVAAGVSEQLRQVLGDAIFVRLNHAIPSFGFAARSASMNPLSPEWATAASYVFSVTGSKGTPHLARLEESRSSTEEGEECGGC